MPMSEVVVYTTIAVVFNGRPDTKASADEEATKSLAEQHASQTSLVTSDSNDTVWKAIGNGAWAQIHVFVEMDRDSKQQQHTSNALGTFRLVAWVLETGKVIVNDILALGCKWEIISDVFRQFTGLDGQIYGFSFRNATQADECSQLIKRIMSNGEDIKCIIKSICMGRPGAKDYLSLLQDIGFSGLDCLSHMFANESTESNRFFYPDGAAIANLLYLKESQADAVSNDDVTSSIVAASYIKRTSGRHLLAQFNEVEQATIAVTEKTSSVSTTSECSQEHGVSVSTSRQHQPHMIEERESRNDQARCNDEVRPEELTHACLEASAPANTERISLPYKTRQDLHVTYNAEHARYEGLPVAWRALNHQFGIPLEAVPKRHVPGYEAKIPAVLQMMKDYLLAHGGAQVEGIFRLAPDKDECVVVKDAINSGNFVGCSDVNIIANLIKVWFRELPQSLFNTIPQSLIYAVCEMMDPALVIQAMDAFPVLYKSLALWLLDLMVEIVKNETKNKMTAKNMAIVMSPNLFSIETDNPMFALTMSQKVADFTYALLQARLQQAETQENNEKEFV